MAIDVYTEEQENQFVDTFSKKYNLPQKYIQNSLKDAVYQINSYQMQLPNHNYSKRTWEQYRRQFIYPDMINNGVKFMCTYQKAIHEATLKYGVPPEIILGIIGVETAYGSNTGRYRVLDTLSTIAFNAPRRTDYFQNELAKYLLMCYQNNWKPSDMYGSIDGGFGIAQFMPSSYLDYAVSYTNKTPDLMVANDAIMSIANYITQHGWKSGELVYVNAKYSKNTCKKLNCNNKVTTYPIYMWKQNGLTINSHNKSINNSSLADLIYFNNLTNKNAFLVFNNFYVIFTYNHSTKYALTTYQLGKEVVTKAHKIGCK
jgi:membrane-bound lytic murein transglycosylase B